MRFLSLRIRGLRCISDATLPLAPGINAFIGANGAGKTSVLEAAYLLSHGRSFRSGPADALQARGAQELTVFAEGEHADGRVTRLGLGRIAGRWSAKVDGTSTSISHLVSECPVVCFEPGTHALIAGGAERRRRYLNWGVFHVEPTFMAVWGRFRRALKQRNSMLRSGTGESAGLYVVWERELAAAAGELDVQRARYVERLFPILREQTTNLVPELGPVELHYRRGWPDEGGLDELLASQRGRDMARGHTTLGAHRADWALAFPEAPLREHLSRGQEKLVALSCVLAQAQLYGDARGEWPIVCMDDLASELDEAHQADVVARLHAVQAQVLVTGTSLPACMAPAKPRTFHVEQGQLTCLL